MAVHIGVQLEGGAETGSIMTRYAFYKTPNLSPLLSHPICNDMLLDNIRCLLLFLYDSPLGSLGFPNNLIRGSDMPKNRRNDANSQTPQITCLEKKNSKTVQQMVRLFTPLRKYQLLEFRAMKKIENLEFRVQIQTKNESVTIFKSLFG